MKKTHFKTVAKLLSATMIVGMFQMGSISATAAKSIQTYDLSGYKESTIYYNGTVITVNDDQPTAEAVLVADGKIIAVGEEDELLQSKAANTKLVNLDGKTMLPGFVDAHSHIGMVSKYDDYTPATGITTIDELVDKVQQNFDTWYATSVSEGTYEDGDWYVGNGYDNTTYPDAENPTADDLDKVSTEVPICIIHTSSHIAVVNHKALEILGYTKGSAMLSYFGDKIETDANGEPTGLLKEDAFFMLYYSPNILYDSTKTNTGSDEENLIEAMNLYASYGITTAQDASSSTIQQTAKNIVDNGGSLLIDINSYGSFEQMSSSSEDSEYENGVRELGIKLVLDGSPQAKTAWLQEPYYVVPDGEDEDYCGTASKTDEEVYDTMVKCMENGYQLMAHTNGSAAIQQFLDQYEKALKDTGCTSDLRPTLIHAQTITEEQLDKCEELGINISFFSDHVYYWGDYHLSSVLGEERANRISPLSSAISRGINVTIHQDSPVVEPNMIFSIHNAVNRVTRDGVTLGAEYAVDAMTAIKAVTINSAYQSFEEDTKGSIEVGKNADFVILDQNPLEVDKTTLKDINVLQTIKDDEVIYTSDEYEEAKAIDADSLNVTVSTSNDGQAVNQSYKISVNEGSIDLSKLQIIYSTDAISEGEQNVWCDYAGIKYTSSPWYSDVKDHVKAAISEGTLSVAFNSDASLSADNGELTVTTRMSKSDWSSYSALTKESMHVYYDGVLVK